ASTLAALAVLPAALTFSLTGAWIVVTVLLTLGVVWGLGERRGWDWAGGLGLAGVTAAAAWGAWNGLATSWLLCGEVLALAVWDLDRFERLLARADRVTNAAALWRGHVLRIAPVLAAALLLGLIALNLQVTLSFAWMILLGVLALLGLSRAIGLLRRESD
ncbi:MAG: hypothetical protein H7Y32_00910, partial [Chloroflexales bacterium]|nr:hypothetical protein [Chloroflexales bacterium]